MKHGKRRVRWGRVLALLLAAVGIWAACRLLLPGLTSGKIAVALDPGHGGSDPGASGIIAETELTEQTVRALAGMLEEDGRFRVILCREYGEGKDLNRRWLRSILSGADLLLSVHGNSADDPTARGFEAYPALPDSPFHEDSLRFARLLAREMGEAGAVLRGDGGIRYAYYDEAGNKLLRDVPDPELEGLPSFAMVQYPRCPAVLAEQCFVTNAEDVADFAGEEGCASAAACYYRAVCAYFELEPKT